MKAHHINHINKAVCTLNFSKGKKLLCCESMWYFLLHIIYCTLQKSEGKPVYAQLKSYVELQDTIFDQVSTSEINILQSGDFCANKLTKRLLYPLCANVWIINNQLCTSYCQLNVIATYHVLYTCTPRARTCKWLHCLHKALQSCYYSIPIGAHL